MISIKVSNIVCFLITINWGFFLWSE